jgi:hypothetical protein
MACTEPLLRKQIGTLHCDGSAFYRTVWLQKTRSLTSVAGLFDVADQQISRRRGNGTEGHHHCARSLVFLALNPWACKILQTRSEIRFG